MASDQKSIEAQLAEFTEVHGTVLLGMHRELQSQQCKVDDKLSEALAHLRSDTAQFRQELWEKSAEIKSCDQSLTDTIDKHRLEVESVETRLRSNVELFRNNVTGLLRSTREDTDKLVNSATDEVACRLKQTVNDFSVAFADYDQRLQASEAKVLNYVVTQQRLLDAQTRELRGLHVRLRKLLIGIAVAALVAIAFGCWRIWAS